MYKLSNKAEVVDEHLGILSRKLEKEKLKVGKISEEIKLFENKRVDEKAIENVKNMVKKIAKELEENLEQKMDKEVYEREKNRAFEKIKVLN